MEELKEAFLIFDTDHDGFINMRELKACLKTVGHSNITKKQVLAMV
jgi:Ca2+-binding EF-hand superfamily protein